MVISFTLFYMVSEPIPHGFDPTMSQNSTDALVVLTFGFLPPMTEKLTRGNHAMWHAQVSATIKGAQLAGFIKPGAAPPAQFVEANPTDISEGKKAHPVPNPEHDIVEAKDQQILS
jgi:hypothetical protein